MHLTKNETKFRNKILKIIKNNDIKDAVNIISNLTFENKKMGLKRAKNICALYVHDNVNFTDKPDNYNYNKELNNTYDRIYN